MHIHSTKVLSSHFLIDISFKVIDGKESFYIFNVVFKCHIDRKRKNEHNPAEITPVWPNMQTNQNLYAAHACRDNDVLFDEYYSQFTDSVIKQL